MRNSRLVDIIILAVWFNLFILLPFHGFMGVTLDFVLACAGAGIVAALIEGWRRF